MRRSNRRPLFYGYVERRDDHVVSAYGFNRYTIILRTGMIVLRALKMVAVASDQIYKSFSSWWITIAIPWVMEH